MNERTNVHVVVKVKSPENFFRARLTNTRIRNFEYLLICLFSTALRKPSVNPYAKEMNIAGLRSGHISHGVSAVIFFSP